MIIPSSITIITAIISIGLMLFSFKLYRRIRKLEKSLFSYQRVMEQKNCILENTVSQIAEAFPPDLNPVIREKKFLSIFEELIQNFSLKLNKTTQELIAIQNNVWNEKFAALLKITGKTEKDLSSVHAGILKDTWESIADLRQKSQLLFDDMREDSIFYRCQSLWLLGNLCLGQNRFTEAWRHYIAALRLYKDSSPKLPLTRSILWQIAGDMIICTKNLIHHELWDSLDKFHISPADIASLFIEIDKLDAHPESLQKIRNWANQIQGR